MLVFIDDSGDPGFKLQAGSIYRSYQTKKIDHLIYKEIIKKHIEDEWKFR